MRSLARRLAVLGSGLALACTPDGGAQTSADASESAAESSESASDEQDDWSSLEESDSETGAPDVPVGPELVDYETCIVDPGAPTATVIGETPAGSFSGQYAWFGWLTCDGDPISPTLVIGESPQDLADALAIAPSSGAVPKPSLEWFLLGHCDPSSGWVGDGGGGVTLRTDGAWELGYGYFAITENYKLFDPVDPDDPPTMKGNLAISEGGWALDGEFTAVYCGALSYALDGC